MPVLELTPKQIADLVRQLPSETKREVLAELIETDTFEAEREDWARLGLQSLERAYGPDEPGYTLDDIKELNPHYAGG